MLDVDHFNLSAADLPRIGRRLVAANVGALRQRTRRSPPRMTGSPVCAPGSRRSCCCRTRFGWGAHRQLRASPQMLLCVLRAVRRREAQASCGRPCDRSHVSSRGSRGALARAPGHELAVGSPSNAWHLSVSVRGCVAAGPGSEKFADVHKLRCDVRRPRRRWLGARHRQDFRAASPHVLSKRQIVWRLASDGGIPADVREVNSRPIARS
jgi:hypothetical protein